MQALDFFEGLEADNSKTYWTANKTTYDEAVYAPMAALIEELGEEFGEGKIFRPYRDVRFSADKTPYKTNIAAVLGEGYISLTAAGLSAGSGMWMMAPDQLARYRAAVADHRGGELEKVIAGITRKKIQVHGHDVLKTVPRGYDKEHPRIDLLRHKSVIASHAIGFEPVVHTPKLLDLVRRDWRATRPLVEWAQRHGTH